MRRGSKPTISFSVRENKVEHLINAILGAELRPSALRAAQMAGAQPTQLSPMWSVVRTHHGEQGLMITFTAMVGGLQAPARVAILKAGTPVADIITERPQLPRA